MSTAPSSMRALVLKASGSPLELTVLPRPIPARGQVLVRIHASGVNPLDLKIRAGQAEHARIRLPAVLGMDLAGVVEELGPDVTGFQRGDAVYGMTGGVGEAQGSLARFAAVDASLLALKPLKLSMREAAALPLGFITAWEGLVDRARVRAGHKVLVHGGAGGVGHLAVQLARARGAEVFATGSAQQAALLGRLGATAIDFRASPVEELVSRHTGGEGFDIVYDTVSGATLEASFHAVRPYVGHVVSCLGWGTHSLAPLSFRGASYSGVFTLMPLLTGRGRAHHGDILREAAKLADAGQLAPRVDPRSFTLETAHEAHAALEARTTAGKLVISLAD